MSSAEESNICVNFFARELKNALEARKATLWTICSRTDIAREVVHRLQQGMLPPGNFSMLNPDDLDKVIRTFQLDKNPLCVFRLRAAIIANSVMSSLVRRIYLEQAYVAAEEIFMHVVQGMQDGDDSLSNIRKVRFLDPIRDTSLESILPLVDRATNALQMSVGMPPEVELEYLWQARAGYEIALQALSEVSETVKATDAWRYWYAAVQRDLDEVVESIKDVQ